MEQRWVGIVLEGTALGEMVLVEGVKRNCAGCNMVLVEWSWLEWCCLKQ